MTYSLIEISHFSGLDVRYSSRFGAGFLTMLVMLFPQSWF